MKFFTSSHRRSGWMSPSSTYLLPPGALRFAASPSASFLRQSVKRSGSTLPLHAGEQLLAAPPCSRRRCRCRPCARAVAISVGVDVDARDLGGRVEARRRGVADDVVHARAEHDDEVGVLERGRAHRQEGQRMVVRHHAAALRRRVERDAGLLDELLHLGPGLRPDHAAAGDDDRLLRLRQRDRSARRPARDRPAGAR